MAGYTAKKEELASAMEKCRAQAMDAMEDVRAHVDRHVEDVKINIREHPFESMAIAAGTGAVIGAAIALMGRHAAKKVIRT